MSQADSNLWWVQHVIHVMTHALPCNYTSWSLHSKNANLYTCVYVGKKEREKRHSFLCTFCLAIATTFITMTLAGFEPTTCTAFKPNSISYAMMLHGCAVRELRLGFQVITATCITMTLRGLNPSGGCCVPTSAVGENLGMERPLHEGCRP